MLKRESDLQSRTTRSLFMTGWIWIELGCDIGRVLSVLYSACLRVLLFRDMPIMKMHEAFRMVKTGTHGCIEGVYSYR